MTDADLGIARAACDLAIADGRMPACESIARVAITLIDEVARLRALLETAKQVEIKRVHLLDRQHAMLIEARLEVERLRSSIVDAMRPEPGRAMSPTIARARVTMQRRPTLMVGGQSNDLDGRPSDPTLRWIPSPEEVGHATALVDLAELAADYLSILDDHRSRAATADDVGVAEAALRRAIYE